VIAMNLRSAALLLSALPLALALAACDKKADTAATTSGTAIAKVAPPAGKSWADTVTKTADGGYLMGNPAAPIKLMEVGALSCSHCADFSEAAAAEIRDTFVASGRVSFELRLHMNNGLDVPAALLATCGPVEATIPLADQFWANQKAMFATLQQNEALYTSAEKLPPEQRFATIAKAGGMDSFFAARGLAADQASTCLADAAKATALVAATDKAGKDLDIKGTPTFFINGSKLEVNTWPLVKADLEKAGAR
jgi:protein-disulfide isomerase